MFLFWRHREVYALLIYWEVGNTPNIEVYVLKGRLEGAYGSVRNIKWSKSIAFEKQVQRHFLLLCWKIILEEDNQHSDGSFKVSLSISVLNSVLNEGPLSIRWRKTKRIFDEKKNQEKERDDCKYANFPSSCLSTGFLLKGLLPSNYLLRKLHSK